MMVVYECGTFVNIAVYLTWWFRAKNTTKGLYAFLWAETGNWLLEERTEV